MLELTRPLNRKIDKAWWEQQRGLQESKWRAGPGLQRAFQRVLAPLACEADAAPWVARRLLDSSFGVPQLADLGAADMLSLATRLTQAARSKTDETTDCPGGRGLRDDELNSLDKLVADAEEREREEARGVALSPQ